MCRLIRTAFLLFLLLLVRGKEVFAQPLSQQERQTLTAQFEQAFVEGLLHRWYPLAIDQQYGGFHTSFTADWQLAANQDKMIVTQARHTWLPAKAAQLYPHIPALEQAATHGFHFLRDQMWDKSYGGFYTWMTPEGKPKNQNDLKTAYGNAFGIYALSAYYQTFGDTAALHLAQQAFRWLEKAHDPKQKGYFQNLQRDGSLATTTSEDKREAAELAYKDQNSSIHLLEAFTELYRVWPDPLLKERLSEMLFLIRDTITTERGNLTLFFTPNWQPISYRDSSETMRKAHQELDHLSFGHDVETAYLLLEASHVLGLSHDPHTQEVTKRMVDQALQHGWDKQNGGFYEKGYYFKGGDTVTIIDDRKNWWAQAEGLNTLLLMAEQYPLDPLHYKDHFLQQWEYIQKYLIDPEQGGWYEWGADKNPERKTGLKGHAWKAAYHDGRSLMNCLQRLRPDTVIPTTPGKPSFKASQKQLHWQASQDNQHVVGYDIYQNKQRIGFTPATSFSLPSGKVTKGAVYTIVAVDAQGNQSKAARLTLAQ